MRKIRFCFVAMLVFALVSATLAYAEDLDEKARKTAKFGDVRVERGSPDYRGALKSTHGKKVSLSKYGIRESLERFHGMWYFAKTKKAMTVSAADKKGGTVKVGKGEEVVIVSLTRESKNAVCKLKGGRAVLIPRSKLKVTLFIYDSHQAYADAQVEEWVNARGLTSKSDYLFLISKYNQRGWIMTKSGGEWKCKYVLKLTTSSRRNGKGNMPNDLYSLNKCAINTHYIHKKGMGKGISYHSKEGGNQIHYRGNSLYPSTHGCVGMGRKDYNFVYNYLPYGTRVVLF